METALALIEATYYDDFDDATKTVYGILQGETMIAIGEELDEWFGKDLLSCKVTLLAPGGLEISREIYETLTKES